ncbi:DUF4138 domain-containing protein [Flavobacterium sp.]|uniref:DUF4138 domain-containing protein n=1 Tax=Flavobacterium sp. TaxID=239 RepID=UPI00374FE365
MTKKFNILLFLFATISLVAQEIKVNENKFVTLIFSSNIISATTGNKDFRFTYDENGEKNMGLLKAKPGAAESNVTVQTSDNRIYNINLIYSKIIKETIVKINKETGVLLSSETNTPIVTKNEITDETDKEKTSVRENDYTIGETIINDAEFKANECTECDKLLKIGKYVKRVNSQEYDIRLDLENVSYANSKIYVCVNIANKSNIDYKINYIKTYIKQSKDNTSSNQYLEKNPKEIYNTQHIIKGRTNRQMIFIYDQFTIDNNKNLVFELNEANGERNLFLYIPHFLINNPVTINK